MSLTTPHPAHAAILERLGYVLDHYTGAVPERGEAYLVKHEQGESDAAYAERAKIATYTPHFAFAVDSLAGQLFAKEDEAERECGDVLGDPEEEGTIMRALWQDADGAGTNWLTLWKQFAARLIACREWYVLVEGAAPEGGNGRTLLVDPRKVIDWIEVGGVVTEAVLAETVEVRGSVFDEPKAVAEYVVYRLDGWARYRSASGVPMGSNLASLGGGDPVLVDEGAYDYRSPSGQPVLPLRRISVPMQRDLGYVMARAASGLYNLQSTMDFRLWSACVNRLHIAIDPTVATPKEVADGMREGHNLIVTDANGSANYIHPSQEPAQASADILEKKVAAFYQTFFRGYADEGKQATATQVMQDAAAGVEAFLVLLAGAVDEGEAFALRMLEQAQDSSAAKRAGESTIRVERASSYQPVDTRAVAEQAISKMMEGVPVGATAAASLITRWLDTLRVDYEPEEVDEAVQEWMNAPDREAAPGAGVTGRQLRQVTSLRERVLAAGGAGGEA